MALQYEKQVLDFERLRLSPERSLWKYMDALPLDINDEAWRHATMGEGGTPLIPLDPANKHLYAKAEFYSPTLSFKDRGAAVLMAVAKKLGVKSVVADSSGNAGTAIAAYGARLGIHCDIFVPEATSDKKVAQICAHGASIHRIPGSREATAAAAIDMVEKSGAFYASHVYNPFFYEGTKTYFYEVFEQMGKFPDTFIIPVGNGTLLLGAALAFEELLISGHIKKRPKILAVQAENCSPIYQAFYQKLDRVDLCECSDTLAEGIAIAAPFRGAQILKAVREAGGDIVAVNEERIAKARETMAQRGVYVEITSAANYAAYELYLETHPGLAGETLVMPLCGAGIKSN